MKASKQMKRQLKQQPITMTPKEIEKIKEQAMNQALEVILGMVMLSIRDEFEFGKDRLLRFKKRFDSNVESYNMGYVTMPDMWETLEKETGIKFIEEEK